MASLMEHLRSPQYPGEEPLPDDAMTRPGMSLVKISGGWVQPGQPRWRAYLFFAFSLIGGLFLVLTSSPGGLDMLAIFGVGFLAFGVYGIIETALGRRLPRPFTRDG